MSTNNYRPHLIVLPEDDAFRQIANGFLLFPSVNLRCIKVMGSAGGWKKVVDIFKDEYVPSMQKFQERRIVLTVDCDNDVERLQRIKDEIPPALSERTFVLGVLSNAEDLKRNVGLSYEEIGKLLAQDCANVTRTTWSHELLKVNEGQLEQMLRSVRPFLFM